MSSPTQFALCDLEQAMAHVRDVQKTARAARSALEAAQAKLEAHTDLEKEVKRLRQELETERGRCKKARACLEEEEKDQPKPERLGMRLRLIYCTYPPFGPDATVYLSKGKLCKWADAYNRVPLHKKNVLADSRGREFEIKYIHSGGLIVTSVASPISHYNMPFGSECSFVR